MDTWDVKSTAEWLCQIGLNKKYAITCEENDVSGRSLLMLASRGDGQLMSVLGLKSASTIRPGRGGTSHLTDFDETWPV